MVTNGNLFITTFESIAMLLAIGVIGFHIVKKRIMPTEALGVLQPLAIDIALPALVFTSVLTKFDPYEYTGWWVMPLWWGISVLLFGTFSFLFSYSIRRENRSEFRMSLFYQNAIFFPLAILIGMFGNESVYLVNLFFFTLFFPPLLFNTYQIFFRTKGRRQQSVRFFNPVFLATITAIMIRYAGLYPYVPHFVVASLKMVGAMTVPLLMIIFGGNLYLDFENRGTVFWREMVTFVVVKNIAFPLLMLGMFCVVPVPYPVALILLLESAVPPVTMLPVLTARQGGNQNIVNQFMFGSFVCALVTIPCMIALFEKIVK